MRIFRSARLMPFHSEACTKELKRTASEHVFVTYLGLSKPVALF